MTVQRGESIRIVAPGTALTAEGVEIALRSSTVYQDGEFGRTLDPSAITPGVRVSVSWRSVGERRPVADKVRLTGGDSSSSG